MAVELSVGDVREALRRAAAPDVVGSGEAATLLLGRVFHQVFADWVGRHAERSGLRVIVEAGGSREQRTEYLLSHTWRQLVAPRLRRHAPALQTSSREVIVLWRAVCGLGSWLTKVVVELQQQGGFPKGTWEPLAELLQSEVPVACELREPGYREPVRLVGIADSVLRVPGAARYCAIELKLGRAAPVVDLGQVALYHLMLQRRAKLPNGGALALMRFSPELEEVVVEGSAVVEAQQRLLRLIGELAGVWSETRSARPSAQAPGHAEEQSGAGPAGESDRVSASAGRAPECYAELANRLLRAYREQGVSLELRGPALVGPRFLRFDVRLGTGVRVERLRQRTAEVQHRLGLRSEPLVTQELGRLFVDVERPDPESVPFASLVDQLPRAEPLVGSAHVPVGVDAAGRLHCVDISTPGRSHVLAAGTTGSGKTEWLRMAIAGLAARNTPETLRFVTLDPKLAAFAELEGSPFLWKESAWWIPGPGRSASEVFADLIDEMERRYALTRKSGSDNLSDHVRATGEPLARIVCVCDEYFALISQSREEKRAIEEAVALLGAKARAAGIHLVLATQQPSRQVISGAIQANLPCRVALFLQSHIESNMIVGARGAERLTGKGDLLYKDFGNPVRLQAPLLSAEERASWLGAGAR